jgi:GNAT superfamily N-acetyltransferase
MADTTLDQVTIGWDRPDGPVGALLVRRLVDEMESLYPELGAVGSVEPAEFEPPDGAFVVAWVGGRPAGCGGIRRLVPGVAEVKRMYVEPWARGRGHSRRILAALEEAALRAGYSAVRLETGTRQPEAVGLYESSGYRRIPCYGEYAGAAHSVCFEKTFGPGR